MLLRPRQQELVANTIIALKEHGNTLAVAPTGSGKTIMFSAVLGELFKADISKACVIAHRDEITCQNEAKFKQVNPNLSTSRYNSSNKSWDGEVTFAMIQTLSRENNLASMPALGALVIDEAHHARADSYLRVIEHARRLNPELKLLGMTATPNRGDKLSLRSIFNNVVDQVTVKELILSGHLVPPRTFVIDTGIGEDLSKVRKTALDYDMNAVSSIMNTVPVNDAVVKHWQEKAGNRKTVIFCSTVKHALDVTESFNAAGISAVCVDGEMSEAARSQAILAYTSNKAQVIVNVAVLTEGWDFPPTDSVVLLRPSSYKSVMVQMIGRGLRTIDMQEFPGVVKEDCIVLDFGTSSIIHGSLEQEVDLHDRNQNKAVYKNCLQCQASVPVAAKECALCGYVFKSINASMEFNKDEFSMKEIDLLNSSNFLWCDVNDDNHHFLATGFDSWAGVFLKNGSWYAVGGGKDAKAKLLAIGTRTLCFAKADDYLNLFENESAAYKTRSWLNQPPTQKQLQYLPQYLHDYNLTRYKASNLITMKFNHKEIQKVIKQKRIA